MAELLPRLPAPDDRITIAGQTGTGKTVAGVWHLSKMDFDERPCIIVDFKGDKLINAINRAQYIDIDGVIPDAPGIYIVRVMRNDPRLSDFFYRVYDHENVILYIDEGFMVGQYNDGFDACLTQGRSKNITMIILTQRPVGVSLFAFTEASFLQVFDLAKKKDRERIKDDAPLMPAVYSLEKHHSYYYDVAQKTRHTFGPVPSPTKILASIDAKLPRRRFRTL
jgi:hypothetical protein